jgi:hypothetical protein
MDTLNSADTLGYRSPSRKRATEEAQRAAERVVAAHRRERDRAEMAQYVPPAMGWRERVAQLQGAKMAQPIQCIHWIGCNVWIHKIVWIHWIPERIYPIETLGLLALMDTLDLLDRLDKHFECNNLRSNQSKRRGG